MREPEATFGRSATIATSARYSRCRTRSPAASSQRLLDASRKPRSGVRRTSAPRVCLPINACFAASSIFGPTASPKIGWLGLHHPLLELSKEILVDRLHAETAATDSVIVAPAMVGAWAQVQHG